MSDSAESVSEGCRWKLGYEPGEVPILRSVNHTMVDGEHIVQLVAQQSYEVRVETESAAAGMQGVGEQIVSDMDSPTLSIEPDGFDDYEPGEVPSGGLAYYESHEGDHVLMFKIGGVRYPFEVKDREPAAELRGAGAAILESIGGAREHTANSPAEAERRRAQLSEVDDAAE